jgi:oligopeptide/dipeptide ABC transporter ATP-binding protein
LTQKEGLPTLEVRNLRTYLNTPRGRAWAVDGVSFTLPAGKIRAIVGESGCGKSVTALSIMQLLPEPAGFVDSGQVLLEGKDLFDLTWSQMRDHRGVDLAMIFQEPMTSLNPVFTIGNQVTEAVTAHGGLRAEARDRAIHLLERVGIEDPARVLRQYPHELSGGMRQRVMIAIALANRPKVLIADEPTTALDVTVQAQILSLMREIQQEMGMAILLITHDLAVVAEMADDVSVMYAGQVVEDAPVREIFRNPQHPYTRDLLASLPTRHARGRDLNVIEGSVPPAVSWPKGCRYANRCRFCVSECEAGPPAMVPAGPDGEARCIRLAEIAKLEAPV